MAYTGSARAIIVGFGSGAAMRAGCRDQKIDGGFSNVISKSAQDINRHVGVRPLYAADIVPGHVSKLAELLLCQTGGTPGSPQVLGERVAQCRRRRGRLFKRYPPRCHGWVKIHHSTWTQYITVSLQCNGRESLQRLSQSYAQRKVQILLNS